MNKIILRCCDSSGGFSGSVMERGLRRWLIRGKKISCTNEVSSHYLPSLLNNERSYLFRPVKSLNEKILLSFIGSHAQKYVPLVKTEIFMVIQKRLMWETDETSVLCFNALPVKQRSGTLSTMHWTVERSSKAMIDKKSIESLETNFIKTATDHKIKCDL